MIILDKLTFFVYNIRDIFNLANIANRNIEVIQGSAENTVSQSYKCISRTALFLIKFVFRN